MVSSQERSFPTAPGKKGIVSPFMAAYRFALCATAFMGEDRPHVFPGIAYELREHPSAEPGRTFPRIELGEDGGWKNYVPLVLPRGPSTGYVYGVKSVGQERLKFIELQGGRASEGKESMPAIAESLVLLCQNVSSAGRSIEIRSAPDAEGCTSRVNPSDRWLSIGRGKGFVDILLILRPGETVALKSPYGHDVDFSTDSLINKVRESEEAIKATYRPGADSVIDTGFFGDCEA